MNRTVKKFQTWTWILGIVSILLGSCSLLTQAPEYEIKVENPSSVSLPGEEPKTLKAGESMTAPSATPVLIESPGFVSMYLVPMRDVAGNVTVNLKPIDQWAGDYLLQKNNALISDILDNVQQVQQYLSTGKTEQAIQIVDALKNKYPQITYLDVLKASCLVVAGNQAQALALLEKSLKDNPNQPTAKRLFDRLSGKKQSGEESNVH